MTVPTLAPVALLEHAVDLLTALHEGLSNGTLEWDQWDADLTCQERQQVAVEESWEALQQAREQLRRATEAEAAVTP